MQIRSLEEANRALLPYVQRVHSLMTTDTALQRIAPLMAATGNPHKKLRIVHLAGTSGKTSTAYFMAALLRATGKNVGLTVSPHVDSVTERVQLNGVPISEQEFCSLLGAYLDIAKTLHEQPTYFELLYAFSFWVFARKGVDYAVVETGMGGLFDPTNIADRTDKLCIITDIGFDHMHVLGHTLPEIAAQKAGIIHPKNPVIMYSQSPEINRVVEERVKEQGAALHLTTSEAERQQFGNDFAATMPDYQQHNWLLAYAAYRFLQERDGLPDLSKSQLQATQQVQVPARMDRRQVNGKTIIMDGAHNGQKMGTFLASFKELYPNTKPAVLLALKESKEPTDIAPLLVGLASRIIITTFETSQDLPAKSIDPNDVAAIFKQAGASDVVAVTDMHQAYEDLLAGPEDVCIITGSFYLLSQLRGSEGLR